QFAVTEGSEAAIDGGRFHAEAFKLRAHLVAGQLRLDDGDVRIARRMHHGGGIDDAGLRRLHESRIQKSEGEHGDDCAAPGSVSHDFKTSRVTPPGGGGRKPWCLKGGCISYVGEPRRARAV